MASNINKPLMHYVKDVLVRAKAQQNDESYYLWAVKFFMEFNRGHNFQVGLVSETMSVPMFYYVQQQMEKYYDMIKVEKKKFSNWVRRLHLALRAYKELTMSYLVDLVETVHLFLKMLEHYCKKTGLVVQKKVRKKTKTKKQKPTPKPKVTILPEGCENTLWEEIRPQLAAVLSAGIQHYLPPFDAASDTHIDEQK